MSIIQNIKSVVNKALEIEREIKIERFNEGVEIISARFEDREDIMVITHVDPQTAKQSMNVVIFDQDNNIIGQMVPSLINQVFSEPVGVLVDALHREVAKKPLESTAAVKMKKVAMLGKTGS